MASFFLMKYAGGERNYCQAKFVNWTENVDVSANDLRLVKTLRNFRDFNIRLSAPPDSPHDSAGIRTVRSIRCVELSFQDLMFYREGSKLWPLAILMSDFIWREDTDRSVTTTGRKPDEALPVRMIE